MKYEEIKLGMKVVPISKSIGLTLELAKSPAWKIACDKKQPFLFVNDVIAENTNRPIYICDDEDASDTGDFFLPEDLIPYKEGN